MSAQWDETGDILDSLKSPGLKPLEVVFQFDSKDEQAIEEDAQVDAISRLAVKVKWA
ncbi:hypothetical protein KSF_100460 [Reticulibacter mediterranei]|uniref:Uncharacterized protein n=1 Tax=Reticulibacter mediterranei TaxID=2778369 RepID=A0A8J3N8S4_9CHLR|nr:hypothetical protein [Reticulibacter mediterranei]GHO99998.1 hypothetical protein KSF_100460 [Reticulibacter mediterranei]